jgi:hypothetical protein
MNNLLRFVWNLVFKLTGLEISFGASYFKWDFFMVELLAEYQGVEEILASRNLIPLKDVQIVGPYYEISFQVPVEALDRSECEHFTHLYLPVTSESARWPGADITGFPKFIFQMDTI